MEISRESAQESWKKFLNPDSLRFNLTVASIYLAAWETFRRSVIGRVESFYLVGFDENGLKFSEAYQSRVVSRDKSPFRASMLRLLEQGAINEVDIGLADRSREHRNEIAHDLPRYIASAQHNVDVQLLVDLCQLMNKIDVWWIRNVEIPTNPDFDDQDVDAIPDSEIKSGNMIFMEIMLNIASGNEDVSRQLFEEFVRRSGNSAK